MGWRQTQSALPTPRRFSRRLSKPLPFPWLTCAELGQEVFAHVNLRTINPCNRVETPLSIRTFAPAYQSFEVRAGTRGGAIGPGRGCDLASPHGASWPQD
jgi:hypothetical protein